MNIAAPIQRQYLCIDIGSEVCYDDFEKIACLKLKF
jgi:hypothetical protein